MKLDRLTSTTTPQLSQEAKARARHVADESIWRVGAMEGAEGDRQRSLQQEIAEFDQRTLAPFAGGEQVLAEAHQLAAQLSSLGVGASALLKAPDRHLLQPGVDAKA